MMNQFSKLVASTQHYVVHTVLHADDPLHRLALGIAIGIFVTFTPTIGAQMAIVVFLAWLLNANKLVGVPLVWISNPVTFVPIYYPCYWLGQKLLDLPDKNAAWWHTLHTPPTGRTAALHFYYGKIIEIILPLTVGCLIISTLLAVAAYYFSYFAIRTYRVRRWGQLVPPKN
jgi:uncharacterized protein